MTRKKCIILARVSTDRQDYQQQLDSLTAMAKNDGYSKVYTGDEGHELDSDDYDIYPIAEKESGIKLKEDERKGLSRLKELVETGKFDRVYVWELDRLGRRQEVLHNIFAFLKERKVQLTIKEPSTINLLNPDGTVNESAELMVALFASLAESEMRNKKARFSRAKDDYYQKGMYMGGKILRGYKVNEQGFWEVDNDATPGHEGAAFVRLVFDLYKSGEFSLRELAMELKECGYFSNVKNITNIQATLSRMLKNEAYIGKSRSKNVFPPIIGPETWEQCCKKRKANINRPKAKGQYLLNTLIHCSCGASYCVNKLDGTYECRVRHNAVEKGLSHSPAIRASLIESLVWWVTLQELSHHKMIDQDSVNETCQKEIAVLNAKIQVSKDCIDTLETKKSELDTAYFTGDMPKAKYESLVEKQKSRINEEREKVRRYQVRIAELEKQMVDVATFDEFVDSLNGNFDNLSSGCDNETMRLLVHRYITKIEVEAIPGRRTNRWKKVTISTLHDAYNKEAMAQNPEIAYLFSRVFYVDTINGIVYFDEAMQHTVPYLYMDRIPRTRKK